MSARRTLVLVGVLIPFLLLWALFAAYPAGRAAGEQRALNIVATTNIVGDAVRRVAGEAATVTTLMGPGVDPHLYRATQGDMRRLAQADVIFYNGLHLEGKLSELLARMSRSVPTFAVTEYMSPEELLEAEGFQGVYDPHVWFDVSLWIKAVERIRDALMELDPERAEDYSRRAAEYIAELRDLHRYVQERVQTIPEERRVLVTAHDAFGYFGRAYGIEVIGLQGISTDTEVGLADVARLVNTIAARRIPAIFAETSVSERGIQAVVEGAARQGHRVVIGGELFSDALGAEGTPEGTYVGMIRHNVDVIAEALR